MSSITILDHPLAHHHVAVVRNKRTGAAEFRGSITQLSILLAIEATRLLPTNEIKLETPVAAAAGRQIANSIALVPVLRAGLGMVDAIQCLLPDAAVWHLGLFRDEATATPVHYYDKLPADNPPAVAMILDPMLATGGSIDMAIRRLQTWGVDDIRVLSVIGSETGTRRILDSFPDIRLFVAAVDQELDEQNYIVPGLGDAGDRIFDTL